MDDFRDQLIDDLPESLDQHSEHGCIVEGESSRASRKRRRRCQGGLLFSILAVLLFLLILLVLVFSLVYGSHRVPYPEDPYQHAVALLRDNPVADG